MTWWGKWEREADVSVTLAIGVERYEAEKLTLKGEHGKQVKVGPGRRFTWDVLADLPGGFEGEITWEVTATGSPVAALPSTKSLPTFTSPTLGATFVLIPAGMFMMGSPLDMPGRSNDESPHHVTISKPYYMQTTEMTQGQWKKVMGNNPSGFSSCGDDCPVEQVSWDDVQEFIRKLNQKEGTDKYRLPTEAEWEYAARAGTTTMFYTGNSDEDLSKAGWYLGNTNKKTHPVAQKTPNAWGLYDMHGNVCEWVQDRYSYHYPPISVTDPSGPSSGSGRVCRGGSYDNGASMCNSSYRNMIGPAYSSHRVGFRLTRAVLVSDSPSIDKPAPVSRAIEHARDGRFIAYDNGTVLDTNTNLMWAAKDNGIKIDWANAKSFCENYRGGGYKDWRMPRLDELTGLYTSGTYSDKIKLTDYWVWTSGTGDSLAVYFNFNNGLWGWLSHLGGYYTRVLPVRSAK